MKKINFTRQVFPHLVAIVAFLLVTVFFFNPIFFDNKTLVQHDIAQSIAGSKALADYRNQTGEEALWAPAMYSGMPAYMVSVQWGNTAIGFLKRVLTLSLPHPVANIFLAFICYYIMLLAFGIRPYLAIAGAFAFGLSSFMIIGLGAGHNARIGATALVPLVIAGIHLAFSGKRVLGFGVTGAALALHLRENHLQVTYYMILIVLGYGLMQLIVAIRDKKIVEFAKTIGILIPAALLAAGTFFGQLWAVKEYSAYSARGKNELTTTSPTKVAPASGMNRDKAFEYSNGILEPITFLIPNFYGGSSQEYLVQNTKSETYQALVNSGNNQQANQLAAYTSPYWGDQPLAAPYYGSAIIVLLFVVGILFAERKYVWWLVSISAFAIVLSWGKNFESFNYFLFDHLPGYNKFRSVTFALSMAFLAMPLLGLLGLEKLFEKGINPQTKKKLWVALGLTGGVCLLLLLFGGMFAFMRGGEENLPNWFLSALRDDRKSLMRGDALRSLGFIAAIFIVIYFDLIKKISPWIVCAFIAFMVMIDLTVIDQRYFAKENYKRKREAVFALQPSEEQVLKDKSYYRVYDAENGGRASYFFNSVTGYHGAILRRYQDLMDSCLYADMGRLSADAQTGKFNFANYSTLNMLNCKYIIYGEQANAYLVNDAVAGPAWFVQDVVSVNTPTEELAKINTIDTRKTAVIDASKFKAPQVQFDSTASIINVEHTPRYLKYESQSQVNGLGVFSEIYYPDGWIATIDGNEAPILRVNYVLRALEIPAGKHTIEFKFEPRAYTVGNKVTAACSWLMLLVLLGSMGWTLRKEPNDTVAA
ncbi:MAG TPA: YfhO family protein [Cyclobacteriaceae bacterium]|nr:YfhO family protein [Cyclobacteriaceae bacterium]HMV09143.1 YfhO family protein [Cyclobacteriaceae bacterium]HMV91604.1 YfhO family protein [Cyclobacteriaceae bacterium]HMX01488.1 YfhO family protein [Cyclobacteriaceae bacterium]HMX50242.1 YfhO family protein [Cyclobacteriaceae bacterium]